MALGSITTSNKFQQLGSIMESGKDKQHVKLEGDGSSGKFKIGFSSFLGKIKYALMSDKPVHKSRVKDDGTIDRWTAKSPRSEMNGSVKVTLNNVIGTAANQTALGQLMKDLETLAKDPRYKDSPLINTEEARNKTLQEFSSVFKEKYQETFSTVTSDLISRELKGNKDVNSGVGRVTVGQLKETVKAVDAQVNKAYTEFLGSTVLGKLEDSVKGQVTGQLDTLTKNSVVSDFTRNLGAGLDLGPAAMNKLTAHVMMGNVAEGDITFKFAQITSGGNKVDGSGPSTVSILDNVLGGAVSKTGRDELIVQMLLGKVDGDMLMLKFGEMTTNKTGGSEGTPFAQISQAVQDLGLKPEKGDMLRVQLLTGALQPQGLEEAIKKALA